MTKRILLIEDDQTMRENTAEILELAQYEVVSAMNGRDGSVMAKHVKPDLIISDIMMPGLDGYGVLHVLSKDPETASIPFIFLTAKAEKSEWRKGMELGADDYITKPFEDTELLNAVEARFKKSEIVKKDFPQNIEGIDDFIGHARGLKELEELSHKRPMSRYKKKEIIFHSGDEPHYLYFLNKGKVKTYKTHDDGKEYITNIYREGDFFGYPALFDNSPYRDSALVMENSEIYKIGREDFISLMYKNREVASKFVKMLASNIEERERQLLRLAYDTVRKRTAEVLLELDKQRYRGEEESPAICVTREDLASMAGTAMETVIRCLGEFKEDKYIEVSGRSIKVTNPEGLQAVQ